MKPLESALPERLKPWAAWVLTRTSSPCSSAIFTEENWAELKSRLDDALGYHRRRDLSKVGQTQLGWIFRRHILHDPLAKIAEEHGVDVTTVENAVKKLRQAMDLQLKSAVECLEHVQRPRALHAY